ncbi:MAG: T9SS type A sorting domain-containing protein [Bacteroidetes bacterium]|nr:T9SS type A sorting domain-containing protein [Bacteroidota bacterium]
MVPLFHNQLSKRIILIINALAIIFGIIFQSVDCLAQDTVKVLFIGNSFTYSNDLPQLVNAFITSDNTPVFTDMYAPGGVSVGDTAQGTSAHMNNPAVYQKIRDNDWDYLVLQDNQGRFAHDSAVFPGSSLVIQGHLKIRDSLHFHHPCAKMIWFSGWGLKFGQPPNWPTGISMIDSITVNYRVLNDTAKDVIAPIGPAWKKCILNNPLIDLWSSDNAHPSLAGSYLTAAVITSVILQKNPVTLPFSASLATADANYLKTTAGEIYEDTAINRLSNIKGILPVSLSWNDPSLHAEPGKSLYRWYLNDTLLATSADSVFQPTTTGKYRIWTRDSKGYWQKSCAVEAEVITSAAKTDETGKMILWPNPASNQVNFRYGKVETGIQCSIINLLGQTVLSKQIDATTLDVELDVSSLEAGIYLLVSRAKNQKIDIKKLIISR